MQVFLPYVDPKRCAKVLDNRRLNKQILECRQILAALGMPLRKIDGSFYKSPKSIQNHPCTKAFLGYGNWLANYHDEMLSEARARGINVQAMGIYPKLRAIIPPRWLNGYVTEMYRGILLCKNPDHYGKFGWKVRKRSVTEWSLMR